MVKRKLATVLSGTAVLGTLAFAPAAFAQDTVIVDRPATSGSTTIVAPSDSVVVQPADTVVLAAEPSSPYDTPIRHGFAAARLPGSVPSPYTDMPASGHIGDEYFFKHSGGVPGA
jgi:hypothetical protein